MQTISTDAETLLRSGALLGLRLSCEGLAGNIILVEEDIVENSFSFSRKSASGNNLEIGSVEAAELSFEIKNEDHRFDSYKFGGAIVTADVKIGSEYLRVGRFTIDTQPRRYNSLKIKALDFMVKFNQYYDGGLPGEVTLSQILQYCCTRCGITLYTTTFLHDDYLTTIPTDDDELLYRDLVGYVAELAGANAWMDWNGELRLTWYGETQATTPTISADDRFEYDSDESDIRITGVVYRTDESDLIAGTDVYALVIEDNPLLATDDAADMISAIHNKIGGLVYRPFDFDIVGLPQIWPGDVIYFEDNNGTVFSSVITRHDYRINDLSRIEAVGESQTVRSYAEVAPFTARQKSVLQKTIDLRAGAQITALDQAMIQLNSLAANAQGFYSTTVTDPATGARIDYMHNSPALATSSVVYKTSIDGFFWTDNYQGESTIWTSGYTASGNIVAKTLSVVGINADWINAGTISVDRLTSTIVNGATAGGTALQPGAAAADVNAGATTIIGGKIRTGNVQSQGYSGVTNGSAFASSGTNYNLDNGSITGVNFRINSNGKVVVKNVVDIYNGLIVRGPTSAKTYTIDGTTGMMNIDCGPFGQQNRVGLYVEGTAYFDDRVYLESTITIDNDCIPSTKNTSYLGTDAKAWNYTWTRQLNVKDDAYADHWYINSSDRRLKKDIEPILFGSELVFNVEPVQYRLLDGNSGRIHFGFIAQQLKEAMTTVGIDDCAVYADRSLKINPETGVPDNEYLTLDYIEMIAPMVQAIQNLNSRLTALEGT